MFGYEGAGQVLLRVILLFLAALVVVRIMGNRTVGQFSPFDFVLMVGIGDIIISASMDNRENFLIGIEGLVALLLLQQVMSYLALKNTTLRKWFEGTPVTLINNGELLVENFKKTHFNYDDLRQELHIKGMDLTHIKDIQTARLESSGDFSLIKTREAEPLTRRDFEDYFTKMIRDPLSPAGAQWARIEQFMEDVHYLAESMRKGNGAVGVQAQKPASEQEHSVH